MPSLLLAPSEGGRSAQIVEMDPSLSRLYCDEVEASLHCPLSHCRGGVKLDRLWDDKEEGFVGGLA